jgi:hypothetical protein
MAWRVGPFPNLDPAGGPTLVGLPLLCRPRVLHEGHMVLGVKIRQAPGRRSADEWHAVLDDYEPRDPVGPGLSRLEAAKNLFEELEQLEGQI